MSERYMMIPVKEKTHSRLTIAAVNMSVKKEGRVTFDEAVNNLLEEYDQHP